jgi:DNA-binding transcriptional regulator YhcF (GntR family)
VALANTRLRGRDAIPLTQEFLGQMLGVRRTTVTFAARVLQSAGMIHYRRGLIQIINRAALEGAACECYTLLRHNIDKVFPPRPFSDKKSGQPSQNVCLVPSA